MAETSPGDHSDHGYPAIGSVLNTPFDAKGRFGKTILKWPSTEMFQCING